MLVGDTDWLYDGFSRAGIGSTAATLSRPINDNNNLFLNLVEFSAGSDDLLEIRSRKSPVRVFQKLKKCCLIVAKNITQKRSSLHQV